MLESFCFDEKLQEGNGTLDPEADGETSAGIVPKILHFFIYKVVEKDCDPGEVINIGLLMEK